MAINFQNQRIRNGRVIDIPNNVLALINKGYVDNLDSDLQSQIDAFIADDSDRRVVVDELIAVVNTRIDNDSDRLTANVARIDGQLDRDSDRATAIEDDISGINVRLANIDSDITDNATRIDVLEITLGDSEEVARIRDRIDSVVDALQDTIADARADADSDLTAAANAIDELIASLDSDIRVSADSDLAASRVRITNFINEADAELQETVDSETLRLTNLINEIEGEIQQVRDLAADADSDLRNNNDSELVVGILADIGTLQIDVVQLDSDINDRIDTVEANQAVINQDRLNDDSDLRVRIENNEDELDYIHVRLEEDSDHVIRLDGRIDYHDTRLGEDSDHIVRLDGLIDVLEGRVDTDSDRLTTEVTRLDARIDVNDGRLDRDSDRAIGIQDDIAGINTRLANIDSDLVEFDVEITALTAALGDSEEVARIRARIDNVVDALQDTIADARANADSDLTAAAEEIDVLIASLDSDIRESADSDLAASRARITAFITQADADLQETVDSETTRLTNLINEIEGEIQQVRDLAADADSDLRNNSDSELVVGILADIGVLQIDVVELDSDINARIDADTIVRVNAESDLRYRIIANEEDIVDINTELDYVVERLDEDSDHVVRIDGLVDVLEGRVDVLEGRVDRDSDFGQTLDGRIDHAENQIHYNRTREDSYVAGIHVNSLLRYAPEDFTELTIDSDTFSFVVADRTDSDAYVQIANTLTTEQASTADNNFIVNVNRYDPATNEFVRNRYFINRFDTITYEDGVFTLDAETNGFGGVFVGPADTDTPSRVTDRNTWTHGGYFSHLTSYSGDNIVLDTDDIRDLGIEQFGYSEIEDGQLLKFDTTNDEWVPSYVDSDDLNRLNLQTLLSDQGVVLGGGSASDSDFTQVNDSELIAERFLTPVIEDTYNTAYTYNASNQLTHITYTHPKESTIVYVKEFTYDSSNRVSIIRWRDDSLTGAIKLEREFTYSGTGQLTNVTINSLDVKGV